MERDGQTDGQTDRIPISITSVGIAVLTCDKKSLRILRYRREMHRLAV